MSEKTLNVLLADDDLDDCEFFVEAMHELNLNSTLSIVRDGEELMQKLESAHELPDVIFLDLNLSCKDGRECLNAINMDEALRHIPVIIYSTSFIPVIIEELYHLGAFHYLRKPSEFNILKQIIELAIVSVRNKSVKERTYTDFVIPEDSSITL